MRNKQQRGHAGLHPKLQRGLHLLQVAAIHDDSSQHFGRMVPHDCSSQVTSRQNGMTSRLAQLEGHLHDFVLNWHTAVESNQEIRMAVQESQVRPMKWTVNSRKRVVHVPNQPRWVNVTPAPQSMEEIFPFFHD